MDLYVKTIGGAGIKGSSEKQQGHFTPLQLNAVNQFTVQVVHTSVLHEFQRLEQDIQAFWTL